MRYWAVKRIGVFKKIHVESQRSENIGVKELKLFFCSYYAFIKANYGFFKIQLYCHQNQLAATTTTLMLFEAFKGKSVRGKIH